MINKAVACRNICGAAQLLLFSAQTLLSLFLSLSPSSAGLIKVCSQGGQLQALPLAGRGRICLFFFFLSKGVIRAGWVHPLITQAGEECSLIIKFACRWAGGTGGTCNPLGNACLSWEMPVCPSLSGWVGSGRSWRPWDGGMGLDGARFGRNVCEAAGRGQPVEEKE